MKGKYKSILGVALTLVLMVTMLAWTVPVAAGNTLQWDTEDGPEEFAATDINDIAVGGNGAVIYATTNFFNLGGNADFGSATWSSEKANAGSYSALLTHTDTNGSVHVDFIPEETITLATLETLANTWSFDYLMEDGITANGPQLELRFTSDENVFPGGAGHVDVTVMALQSHTGTGTWEELILANSTVITGAYGNAPNGNPFSVGWGGTDQLQATVVGISGAIEGVDTDTYAPDDCDEWELTRVRLELYDGSEKLSYIDKVIIDAVTYDLEPGSSTLYVSDDTGESWEEATVVVTVDNNPILLDAAFVAVAPDDPRFVAAADTGGNVYISEDNGATWDSLTKTPLDVDVVFDIAVSLESGDSRFVAVAGEDGAARVDYYEIGALGADWEEISVVGTYPGFEDGDIAGAVAFSPNFNSDEMLACVTYDASATPATNYLQVFSFNTEDWNDEVGGFSGYPVDLNPEAVTATALVAADIAMSPDYLGSDDDLRQVFVGIADTTPTDASGIFFCDDDDVEALDFGDGIHSIDFDGSNLVAGAEADTTVYYSDDPLEGEDADVDNSSSSKSPGGEGATVVRFAGSTVVAGTSGDDSAFAVSDDLGDNFNDLTLIDGGIYTSGLIDFAISADGSAMYLLSSDAYNDMSLWSYNDDNELWERVRFVGNEANWPKYILRIAPDDPDVIYLAETGSTTIYYSSDGGASKWNNRSSRYPIKDLAVETTGEAVYVLTTNGYVSKSVNTGFTWGSKETSGQAGDYSLTSLGEDLLLIGGDEDNPSVAYSTDGNESWIDLDALDDVGDVQVCAEGLAEGDYLFAVTDAADSGIYWLELGEDDWEDDLGNLPENNQGTGIALADGILYVLSENSSTTESLLTRFLDPWGDEEGDESTADVSATFDATPSALRVSTGSTMLWAVSSSDAGLYMYEDTIAQAGPTLKSPANGFTVPINEIAGDPANVSLVWESPSDEIDVFEWEIAFDEDFDEVLTFDSDTTVDGGFDEGDVASVLISGGSLTPDTTFYWHVKVTLPVESPWSDTRSFTVEEAEAAAPVVVQPAPPAPEITVEVPAAPAVTLPAPVVQIPEVQPAIPSSLLWAVVVIGAILVTALIVLIVRTRKVV